MTPLRIRFDRLPFRLKLAALAIASALLSLTFLGVVMTALLGWTAQESMRQQNESVRPLLAAALTGPMIERNYATVREIAIALVQGQILREIVVYSTDGVRVAAEHGGPERLFDVRNEIPLEESGIAFGRVAIRLSAGSLVELLRDLLWAMLASVVVSMLLALSLFRNWSNQMGRRIERLATTAQSLAAGHLDARAPDDTADEIGHLALSFNRMADEIQRQFDDLTTAATRHHQLAVAESDGRGRLEALFAALTEGIGFTDLCGRLQHVNPALRRIAHLPENLDPVGLLLADWQAHARLAPRENTAHDDEILPFSLPNGRELCSPDGREYVETCLPVHAEDQLLGHLWIYDDVTERRRAQRDLAWLAERDALSGLLNRRALNRELERRLAELERRGGHLALIHIDLDDFKEINDSFGHAAGDAILLRVSNHLAEAMRKDASIARMGGDVFAVASWVDDEAAAQELARRLLQTLREMPISYAGRSLHLTASLGIGVAPQHGNTPELLAIAADGAMHRAKTDGRNHLRLFEPGVREQGILRLSWKERLIDALEKNLFELHYQGVWYPDGRLSHAEVLVRLRDGQTGGLIPPGHFIPHAEHSGLIRALDRHIFTAATETLARQPGLKLAVNVSGRSVEAGGFAQFAASTLRAAGVDPARMIVEITETAAVGDLANARSFIAGLRELGCRLALDDFGAGYSSFAYLKHLRADLVKIDGQFVRGLAQERENQIFVRAIAEASHLISGVTIAEFVEDAATADLLPELGVSLMQGYWFDRPAPLNEFLAKIPRA